MRKQLLVVTGLILLFGLGSGLWADGAGQPAGPLVASPTSPILLMGYENLLSLKAAYLAPPKQTTRLTDLLTEVEDRRTLSMTAASSLFQGRLTGEGELAFSPPDSRTIEGRGDPQRRLMRLGLSGTRGSFRYGVTLREGGKAAAAAPDQAMREVWGEWRLGLAKLRTSLGETWNNVEKDPLRARVTQTYERLTLSFAPRSWPEFSLSYGQTEVATSLDPVGVAPQRLKTNALESALAYTGTGWNARASAAYAVSNDLLAPDFQTVGIAYALNGTYRLKQLLTITPSVSLRNDLQRWSGARIKNRSASLSLTYAAAPRFTMTVVTAYSAAHSSDRLVDLTTFNAKSAFTWSYEPIPRYQTSLSLEASHKLFHDAVNPTLSVEDTAGFIRLQFAGS